MIKLDITCAILAGGKASRFNGNNKALIKVGRDTNLDKFIELADSLFSEIILVSNNPELYQEYQNIRIVSDIFTDIGPLAGIHSAIYHSENPNIFLFACDMPFINKDIVIAEINAFKDHNCDIIVPRIIDFFEPLHSIYRKELLDKLEDHIKTTTNRSIRSFFSKVNAYYWDLEDNEENRKAFSNINTHHDYKKALETHAEKER